eukprot:7391237-Lingulodinium_polyedra.AAC.1
MPRHRYKVALATCAAWQHEMPARQALAAPRAFARAAAVLTLAAGHPGVATVFVLCFYGLLRVSEPFSSWAGTSSWRATRSSCSSAGPNGACYS